jgi:hypothetical protein
MLQLTPHDVVNLKLNKGDASTPSLGQGIVYCIKVNTYFNILPYVQFFLQYLGGNSNIMNYFEYLSAQL